MDVRPNYTSYMADNPLRFPEWRSARARWLVVQAHAPDVNDDPWIVRAYRVIADEMTRQSAARTEQHLPDAAVQGAFDLSRVEPPWRRWLVEALLLTSAPFADIADRTALPLEVIEAYHALFFEVRPYLNCGDWVMAAAIGTSWARGFSGLPLGAIWKHVAFSAGPLALELIMAVTLDEPLSEFASTWFTTDSVYQQTRLRLLAKLYAMALITEDSADWEVLTEVRKRLMAADHKVAGFNELTDADWTDEMHLAQTELFKLDACRRSPRACRNVTSETEPLKTVDAETAASATLADA